MSNELSLEGVKEGFSNGVVPAISFAAHALNAAMSFQFRKPAKCLTTQSQLLHVTGDSLSTYLPEFDFGT